MCVGRLVSMQEVAMIISSLLLTTTQDMDVYLMKKKSEALDKFKVFKAESEKQLRRHIKSLVLIEVVSTCLLNLFLSSRSMRFYLSLVL